MPTLLITIYKKTLLNGSPKPFIPFRNKFSFFSPILKETEKKKTREKLRPKQQKTERSVCGSCVEGQPRMGNIDEEKWVTMQENFSFQPHTLISPSRHSHEIFTLPQQKEQKNVMIGFDVFREKKNP